MSKILIIEDEGSLRSRLVEKFNASAFVVLEAKNGEEGLAIALQEHPNIILLDIILPKIHGLDVLKKIREDEWGKTVPVIFLTNLHDSQTMARSTEYGSNDFLVKNDLSLDDVVRVVRNKLNEIGSAPAHP